MIPTLQDEIQRKASGAISRLLDELSRSQISYGEFAHGVRGVWDATAGLVSSQTMDVMASLIGNGVGDDIETRVWRAQNGKLCVLRHWRRAMRVDLAMDGAPSVAREFSVTSCTSPESDLREYKRQMIETLNKIGVEI